MKNLKKQKNKTGQFYAICVKLSILVLSAVSVLEICIISTRNHLCIKHISYGMIHRCYKYYRNCGVTPRLHPKVQAQPDPPLG